MNDRRMSFLGAGILGACGAVFGFWCYWLLEKNFSQSYVLVFVGVAGIAAFAIGLLAARRLTSIVNKSEEGIIFYLLAVILGVVSASAAIVGGWSNQVILSNCPRYVVARLPANFFLEKRPGSKWSLPYSFEVEGKWYYGSGSGYDFPEDERVHVYYNPTDPSRNIGWSGNPDLIAPAVFLCVALVSFALVLHFAHLFSDRPLLVVFAKCLMAVIVLSTPIVWMAGGSALREIEENHTRSESRERHPSE